MTVSKSSHTPAKQVNNATRKEALPRWIDHAGSLHEASSDELLLYFASGGKGERAHDPLVAMAERLAAEMAALRVLLGPTLDDLDVADVLQHLAERMQVLAILMGRAA